MQRTEMFDMWKQNILTMIVSGLDVYELHFQKVPNFADISVKYLFFWYLSDIPISGLRRTVVGRVRSTVSLENCFSSSDSFFSLEMVNDWLQSTQTNNDWEWLSDWFYLLVVKWNDFAASCDNLLELSTRIEIYV